MYVCMCVCIFWAFILFLHLEHIPLSPYFARFAVFISLYFMGCLCFLTLEKWPFVGDLLCVWTAHSPLVHRATYALGVTLMWAACILLLWWADCCGKSGMCVWPLALPCGENARHCGVGLSHRAAGCRSLGGSGARCGPIMEADSRVDGCRAGCPGSSVALLVGGTGSWHGWLWGLGCPEADIDPLVDGSWFHGGWLRSPECSRADVGLLVGRAGTQEVQGWCQASGDGLGTDMADCGIVVI